MTGSRESRGCGMGEAKGWAQAFIPRLLRASNSLQPRTSLCVYFQSTPLGKLVGPEMRRAWLLHLPHFLPLPLPSSQSLPQLTSFRCSKWKEDLHLPFSAVKGSFGAEFNFACWLQNTTQPTNTFVACLRIP